MTLKRKLYIALVIFYINHHHILMHSLAYPVWLNLSCPWQLNHPTGHLIDCPWWADVHCPHLPLMIFCLKAFCRHDIIGLMWLNYCSSLVMTGWNGEPLIPQLAVAGGESTTGCRAWNLEYMWGLYNKGVSVSKAMKYCVTGIFLQAFNFRCFRGPYDSAKLTCFKYISRYIWFSLSVWMCKFKVAQIPSSRAVKWNV